ncbi:MULTISPECIES: S26 family signal peptidase [unclassified Phenylobacterium]|uniref:S26 family signal peptidase n=1 Tax=unclassified Phenylobacterium TaxID=2640670 RepID=UPI00083B122F|nr:MULTISPECIES: S26 family signal peptidase [unclassified Phenylobacterium]
MTRRGTAGIATAITLLASGSASAAPGAWLVVNESPSVPTGIYVRSQDPLRIGVIVAVRPPPAARGYLVTLGAGPEARLLKRVAAMAGAPVCRRSDVLTWPRGAARVRDRDRLGQRLPQWRGCRPLAAGELLVMGDTPTSFDGRYFGPVRTSDIDGVYAEVVRW